MALPSGPFTRYALTGPGMTLWTRQSPIAIVSKLCIHQWARNKEDRVFSHIHSTTVTVADQEAALDFYQNTLGWTKVTDNPVGDGTRWLTVVPPGATTELVLAPAGSNGAANESNKYSGITLVAPDIDATVETLKARGVRFKQPVTIMPWGTKATWFSDLDGNEFFLVAA